MSVEQNQQTEVIIIIKQLITRHNVNSSIQNEIIKTKEESRALSNNLRTIAGVFNPQMMTAGMPIIYERFTDIHTKCVVKRMIAEGQNDWKRA